MSGSKPFLGETSDAGKAFASIESFELEVTQDPDGYYTTEAWQRISRFTMANIQRELACANPNCRQGGLDLQRLVLFSIPGTGSRRCPGHEGSPGGRRRGDSCDNRFEFVLSVTRVAEGR